MIVRFWGYDRKNLGRRMVMGLHQDEDVHRTGPICSSGYATQYPEQRGLVGSAKACANEITPILLLS